MGRSKKHTPLLVSYPDSVKLNKCSIEAEALFGRLLARSDDYGNYFAGPGKVRRNLFGIRSVENEEFGAEEIEGWLDELEENKLIRRYVGVMKDEGKMQFLHIVNAFKLPKNDEPNIIYPTPDFMQTEIRKTEEENEEKQRLTTLAENAVDYLNSVIESYGYRGKYTHAESTIKHIRARLAEGKAIDDIKLIIDYKTMEWIGDDKTRGWVSPTTLFQPSKFDKNLMAAMAWDKNGRRGLGGGNYKGMRDNTDYDEFLG